MRITSFLLAVATLGATACTDQTPASTESAPTQSNVLLILADDLGYHDLGFTGSTFYETPNLDRLARSGVSFTQAYAGSRVCSPSRATIMLGQFAARHGITDWIGARSGENWRQSNRHTTHLPPDYVHALPAEQTTLAEAFAAGGYETFFAGKWHLGGESSYPEDHGFVHNAGGWEKGSPIGGFFDPYKNPKLRNRRAGENLSIRLAAETSDFLAAEKSAPFFAMLSFYAVHAPVQTTRERWDRYRRKVLDEEISPNGYELERRFPIRVVQDDPTYAGLVEQLDLAVGVVLDALDSLGLADNTIVVFTSDNGGVASGDAYATSNLPLRGGKGYQWEGGIREPLLLYVPPKIASTALGDQRPPAEVTTPVTGADLYPTLLSLTGLPPRSDQHLDGQDLSPLLRGDSLASRPLYWHYPHYGNQGGDPSSILRSDDWKLIHYWEDGHTELYDLTNDPAERQDLSRAFPDRTKILRGQLLDWLEEVDALYLSPDTNYDSAAAADRARFYADTLRIRLEQQRLDRFRPDWQPNEDWWGSQITEE